MNTRTEQWIFGAVVVVIALVLAGIAWLRYDAPSTPPEPAPAPAVAEPESPQYPVTAPDEGTPAGQERAAPLPPLGDSDDYISLALGSLFGGMLDGMLADEAIVEKFVATIDNLPRDKLAERLRPIAKVPGDFSAREADESGRFVTDPGNAARYDALVALFTNTQTDELLDAYRRSYPLLQEAYVGLGYPDGYFNDRLVAVIDHLLATPDPSETPLLVRPHVLYEYADPELERLSSGQKALLRMGTPQRSAVKDKLRELRTALARSAPANAEPLPDEGN